MTEKTDAPVLEARGVRKGFEGTTVLDGVDLSVGSEEILMLMGPNGAGKSVFMACLAASADPDDGTIEFFGGRSPHEARSSFNLMMQGQMIDPDLTGRENLQFYNELHPCGTDNWSDLVERLDIADALDRPVGRYSGGMQRKLEVVVTLSADVPFYLLDEPTAELDLSVIRTLHDIILEQKAEGKSVLMNSHTPLDAQIADRIAFLHRGQIVAAGEADALLDQLPRVIRVRGEVPPEDALLGGRMFRRGDEIRGFLNDGSTVKEVERACKSGGNVHVDLDPPSYTDLFNYFTQIQPRLEERAIEA